MSVVTLEFLRAAALGDINRLRALLAQGVDINSTNKANQTALMLAAAFKQAEIVRFLLSAGANVSCQDELGLTAADWAQQQTDIAQLINSAEPLRGSLLDQKPTAAIQIPAQTRPEIDGSSPREFGSVILRANKRYAQSVSPEVVATAAARAPISAEVDKDETVDSLKRPAVESTDDTVAPAATTAPISIPAASETVKQASRVDIPLPQPPHTRSAAMKALLRVSIVIFLLVAGFVSYHLLTRRTSGVQPEPIPTPVHAETKPTKSAPVVGGELAGTELFLADAKYPRQATVESANVTVGIQVNRKGIVLSAKAIDGDESLRTAAEKAAKSSAFAPDKLEGRGAFIRGTITYNFLKNNDSSQHGIELGFSADAAPTEVTATAGGPLVGAERKLEIPPVPSKLRVVKEAVTVVVRVSRTGRVVSWRPLDADARLRAWVISGARASTFDPAKLPREGDVVGTITYTFR